MKRARTKQPKPKFSRRIRYAPELRRVMDFLDNPSNIRLRTPVYAGFASDKPFSESILREYFITRNGIKISIQQGATHYTNNEFEAELWRCPHLRCLATYGTGDDPYAYVPLDVVAQYVWELEHPSCLRDLRDKALDVWDAAGTAARRHMYHLRRLVATKTDRR